MVSLDSDLTIFSRGTILSRILLLWSQRYIKTRHCLSAQDFVGTVPLINSNLQRSLKTILPFL